MSSGHAPEDHEVPDYQSHMPYDLGQYPESIPYLFFLNDLSAYRNPLAFPTLGSEDRDHVILRERLAANQSRNR
jgi:hypothetical protein